MHALTVFAANSAMYRNLSRRLAALSRSATAAAAAAASALTSPPPPPLPAPPLPPPAAPPRLESCTCTPPPPPPPALAQDLPVGRHDDILPLLAVRCSRTARGDIGGDAIVARRMMGSAPRSRSRLGGERRTREESRDGSAPRALPRPPLRVAPALAELADDAAASSAPLLSRCWGPPEVETSLRSDDFLPAASGVAPCWVVLLLALALPLLLRRRPLLELLRRLARSGLLALDAEAEAHAVVWAAESLRLRRVRLAAAWLSPAPLGERPPTAAVALLPPPPPPPLLLIVGDTPPLAALVARRRVPVREEPSADP